MHRIFILLIMLTSIIIAKAQDDIWRFDANNDRWFNTGNTDGVNLTLQLEERSSLENDFNLQVSTNVAYDAALVGNLDVQATLGSNWSIGTDGYIAWYQRRRHNEFYQFYGFDIYGRYWFRRTHTDKFIGYHLGLYAGTLTYDIFPESHGYQSAGMFNTFRTGVEFGYSGYLAKKNKNWRVDFYCGLGLFHTRQDKYSPTVNERYKRIDRRWRNYPDFTRFGITIGYIFGNKYR